jgi:hypothetical protein
MKESVQPQAPAPIEPSVLFALAERCEREEPSRELDAEIAVALGHHVEWKQANYTMTAFPAISWRPPHPYAGMREPCPQWTTSLDAAVTLVPASKPMSRHVHQQDNGSWWVELRDGYCTSYDKVFIASAKTEPMAICAAALRARAAMVS